MNEEAKIRAIIPDDLFIKGFSIKEARVKVLQLLQEARNEYPWKRIQRHATYEVPITNLDGAEPFVEYDECYLLPKKWVDEEALKGEK